MSRKYKNTQFDASEKEDRFRRTFRILRIKFHFIHPLVTLINTVIDKTPITTHLILFFF